MTHQDPDAEDNDDFEYGDKEMAVSQGDQSDFSLHQFLEQDDGRQGSSTSDDDSGDAEIAKDHALAADDHFDSEDTPDTTDSFIQTKRHRQKMNHQDLDQPDQLYFRRERSGHDHEAVKEPTTGQQPVVENQNSEEKEEKGTDGKTVKESTTDKQPVANKQNSEEKEQSSTDDNFHDDFVTDDAPNTDDSRENPQWDPQRLQSTEDFGKDYPRDSNHGE